MKNNCNGALGRHATKREAAIMNRSNQTKTNAKLIDFSVFEEKK